MKIFRKTSWLWLWSGFMLGAVGLRVAEASPVTLRAVAASVTNAPAHPLAAAVDGVVSPNNGWSIGGGGQFQEQYAVFAPTKPITATICQFQFSFLSPVPNAHFSDFEVDVTSDEQPQIKGRWVPLIPDSGLANCPDSLKVYGPTISIDTHCAVTAVSVRARMPFSGITGIRLRLFTILRGAGQPASVGCAADCSFVLTEFRVEADPNRTSNIALGRQAYCSCWVQPHLPLGNLTDGFLSTYTQPYPSMTDSNTFFELDLGRLVTLDHIVIRGREDGSKDDCLSTYRIELLTEAGGFAGNRPWQAVVHGDGGRLSAGSADVIRANAGLGEFVGRRIRIYNQCGSANQPQIAELEVYPALQLNVGNWLSDGRPIKEAKEIQVPASTRELTFSIACTNYSFSPNALSYRWRFAGLNDPWHETGPDGRVTFSPPPPPGLCKLEFQACHSDGEWTEVSQFIAFSVAAPWWQNPSRLATVVGSTTLLLAMGWWRIYAVRMRRRLALAHSNVELQRERLRIARDMHDEMGARLTHIALLADRTCREKTAPSEMRDEQLQGLAESARSAVSALDSIVWAVNPEHDTMGDFVDYLCDYAGNYLKPAGVECRFDFHITNPNRLLPLVTRHELLMAVKEALQNVVKHAYATTVKLACGDAGGRLEIVVEDDGCGRLTAAQGLKHRNGLDNMQRRLGEIGGQFALTDGEQGRGTRVHLSLELNRADAIKK
jgi:signal transduction histidine kinase